MSSCWTHADLTGNSRWTPWVPADRNPLASPLAEACNHLEREKIMEASKKDQTTQNAVKLVGEAFLPGASLLMEGKILQGGAHLIAGAAARAFLGPIGWALVIANSYSNSTTGKGILKQFTRDTPAAAPHAAPQAAPPTGPTIIKAP